MIYLTGDIHGKPERLSFRNFPLGKTLTKNDYVIILGDFGLLWNGSNEEKYWINWLNSRPWTTLFIDGNHENFEMIDVLPKVEMFGGNVGKVADFIYHLRRGFIYEIDGKRIFTFGGASSVDKLNRVENISWWAREQPNHAEMSLALNDLSYVDNEVDYILTHTCPQRISNILKDIGICKYSEPIETIDFTRKFLGEIESKVDFKKWYFGHWHDDVNINDKFILLYEKIIKLGDSIES